MELLDKYIKAGFAVFPIQPGSKIPYPGTKWKELATRDKLQVENYAKLYPNCNWAMATGAVSGITVIDVDVKNDGIANYEKLVEAIPSLDSLPTVKTPSGGEHYYYLYDSELRQTTGLVPGVDVRNDGGYVVIPPSTGYETVFDTFDALSPIPSELKQEKKEEREQVIDDTRVAEGGRNNYLHSVAGFLRKQNTPSEAIESVLRALNEEALASPLGDWELGSIANSSLRYSPAPDYEEDPPSTIVRVTDLVTPMLDYLQDKNLVRGEPTGLYWLDELLGGGKRLGEVTCWHAEAKTGKNTLWHYLMHKWLNRGIPIGYASRELTPETEVLPNLLSLEYGYDAWIAEDIDEEQYKNTVSNWPLYFAKGYGYMPIEEIELWVSNLANLGVQYFWIDHLHYCILEPEDHKEASKFVKRIKTLAKRFNVHFDIIIQPNQLMEGQRLSLRTIKGGAAMGQAIDNLLVMHKHRQHQNVREITLSICRSKLAKPGTFFLEYDKKDCSFRGVDIEIEK